MNPVHISDPDDPAQLAALDAGIARLSQLGMSREDLVALLGIFERFPEHDGHGIFWSIVHAVEAVPFDYESELLASVRRMPSEFNTLMINRIANTGQATIAGKSVDDIYRDVLQIGGLPSSVRRQVEGFVARRRQGPLPA